MRHSAALFSILVLFLTASCGQAVDTPIPEALREQPIKAAQNATTEVTSKPAITWRYPDFKSWQRATTDLPPNRQLNGRFPPKSAHKLTAEEFDKALEVGFDLFKASTLANKDTWVGAPPNSETFFDTTRVYFENTGVPFTPFAQKINVEPGAKFITHGDFHGDIHSMIALIAELNDKGILDGFKLKAPDTHFLFLGDYTDRGLYGTEVIYTLIRLKHANPQKVFMARGNHEDLSLTARYGYFLELVNKFGRQYDLRKPMRLYDFLPVVIYVGCESNYIQCNHGGMEPGFDPRSLLANEHNPSYQLLGALNQAAYITEHPDFVPEFQGLDATRYLGQLIDFTPKSPVEPKTLGFMWNDFTIISSEPALWYDAGRAWVYGKHTTNHILQHASSETVKLRGVVRAHQHSSLINPMMRRLVACRGVHRHWQDADNQSILNAAPNVLSNTLESQATRSFTDGSVFTLNVAPDSAYGVGCNYDFDTYAIIQTAAEFTDWTLEVNNIEDPKW